MRTGANTGQGAVRRAIHWSAGDDGARWAFRVALFVFVVLVYVVGRRQWFTQDDWAMLIGRTVQHANEGTAAWLFTAQDGHWLTVPVLLFRTLQLTFGLGSYWPFLLPTLAAHLGCVLLVRCLCRRLGVSAWTTTLICALLLLFGSGWQNIMFAIQISYTISLLAFLGQLVLVDHDGPVERRDLAGSALAVVGLISSGFGPVYVFGVALLLVLRRRWRALLVAAVPSGLLYSWWFLAWETDSAGSIKGSPREVFSFTRTGVLETLRGLMGLSVLAGVGLVAIVAMCAARGVSWRHRSALVVLTVVPVMLYAGIGVERAHGFGFASAAEPRYIYMAAMPLAVVLAVALDQVRRYSGWALWVVRLVLLLAITKNVVWMSSHSLPWSRTVAGERHVLELLAGSELTKTADQNRQPLPLSPDVRVSWIPELVREHAVEPLVPQSDTEIALVRKVLGLTP